MVCIYIFHLYKMWKPYILIIILMKNSTKAFIAYLVNVNCVNILLQLVMHVHRFNHGWGSKKKIIILKWLHSLTLGFYNFHCIIIVVDCCMLKIFKNRLNIEAFKIIISSPKIYGLVVWPLFGSTKVPSSNMLVSRWKPCHVLCLLGLI
jgi:hypothetical protein